MRFLLDILATAFLFSLINAATFDKAAIGTFEKIEEGKYVGSKSLEYKAIDGSIKEDQVFFVHEKLTYTNLSFWENYVLQQKQGAAAKDRENADLQLSEKISDGLDPFLFSLSLCPRNFFSWSWQYLTRKGTSYDIWISFATRKDPRLTSISNEDIELTMSVFVNQSCPFFSGIGISKNYLFFFPENHPHTEIGTQMHASSGEMMRQYYGMDKSHMVTRPTPLMASRMAKKLVEGESIWSPCDMAYAQRTYYINPPPHTHRRFPLDNRDPNTWKLAVSESDVRTFPRPLWFPFDGYTGGRGEHQTLGNKYLSVRGTSGISSEDSACVGADIVAVSIEALCDIWHKPVSEGRT